MSKLKDLTIMMSASASPCSRDSRRSLNILEDRNVRIIGVDMADDPSAQYMVDKFYQVPPATDEGYVDVLLDICKKEKVDIFFPTISAEIEEVARRKAEFDAIGTKLAISNLDSVKIANNKLETYRYLERHGIPVPRYYGVKTVEDFIDGCRYMGYPEKPVCIKIVDGSGSRGVRIIDSTKSRYDIFVNEKPNSFYISYDDMLAMLKEAPKLHEMLLVEYMHGPEYTVDALAENGETLYIGGRENTVSVMSIAMESIVKYDEMAYQIAKDVIKCLQMDGNVGFDFMRNDKGEPVLMDINPRLTATVCLFNAAGMHLQYLRIKQLLGEKLPDLKPVEGTRVKRRYLEIFTTPEGGKIDI